jgi:hypothetical protein
MALATPVPVLVLWGDGAEVVRRLDEGEPVTYTYRQSIYDVPVHEEYTRSGDAIDLRRVRSPDIRSVEYFRWEGDIVQDGQGNWVSAAPPVSYRELTIRVTTLGEQRLWNAGWSVVLRERFGETVVRVRVETRAAAAVILSGGR